MSVGTDEAFHGLEDEAYDFPASGMQTTIFYPGLDPKYNSLGIPTSDDAPPTTLAELLADYREALRQDFGDDHSSEARLAMLRLEEHLGATGLVGDASQN